jgi:hypothetical protein
MDNHDLFTRPSQWRRKGSSNTPSSSTAMPIALIAVIAVIGIGLVSALLLFGGEPPQPPVALVPTAPIVETPTTAPPTPTPAPICVSAAERYLPVIIQQEQQLKWDVAAENAAAAIQDPELCKEDRPILAQKYITDAMEGLYARPFDPSRSSQHDVLERYQAIRSQAAVYAREYGVTPPRSLEVGQRSGQVGWFRLGISEYENAWRDGSFTESDLPLIRDYISLYYNMGFYLTREPTSSTFEEGLRYLATSYHLEQAYRTGQAEAWGRLRLLLGTDETIWPEPLPTPFLKEESNGTVSR